MEIITLTIKGMSCTHCEKAVTNSMEDIGVKTLQISHADGLAKLQYDPAKTSLEKIKTEILDTGYEV